MHVPNMQKLRARKKARDKVRIKIHYSLAGTIFSVDVPNRPGAVAYLPPGARVL